MPVTLLLPGALLPREVVAALAEPLAQSAFATTLARADLAGDSETASPAHLAWLAEHLFQRALPLPTAPYAYAALAGAAPADEAIVWHADPVHLELARDHLVVTPLAAPPEAESSALIDAANALTAELDARLIRIGDRWLLHADQRWDLETEPLAAAVGRPLQTVMPRGTDAGRWNRLLTEIQMTWHAHPVNEAREARGEATVNSVWLSGGGRWSPLARAPFTAVHADAPEWRGAAQAANVASERPGAPPRDGALVVWDDLLMPRLMQDWSAWASALLALDARMAALLSGSVVDVVLAGGATVRRLRIRPSDRLKFWRSRTLVQVLSE